MTQACAPAPARLTPGALFQIELGSGGVKLARFEGEVRLSGRPAQDYLAFRSRASSGLFFVVEEGYLARATDLQAACEPAPMPASGAVATPLAAQPGDRALVSLRIGLTYSGHFGGSSPNPFLRDRPGVLLAFGPQARLVYWIDHDELAGLRVTIPAADGALDLRLGRLERR